MRNEQIRNVAIIAHVDHGKTTLVDQLFRQSGLFRDNQDVAERLMDSMDLERERGITISSKNGAFRYGPYTVNIIDTPGHADFGGQVERVLKMADGALLLVDAQEGPMPQTFFVLRKALALSLPVIVVINKIDKPAARPHWVVDQVFDLFVQLGAPDEILDFPVVYASSRHGYAIANLADERKDLLPLCELIVKRVPPPGGSQDEPLQVLVSSIDYSPYLGRLGIGKITSGTLGINQDVVVSQRDGRLVPARITKMYRFESNQRVAAEHAVFEISEVRRAILPGNGGTQRALRQLPYAIAMEMLLLGRRLTAQEALAYGLINKVVPMKDLMPAAEQYARQLCENGPLAVRAIKELAIRSQSVPLEHGLRLEEAFQEFLRTTEDSREGPRAFAEKRKPAYKAQ